MQTKRTIIATAAVAVPGLLAPFLYMLSPFPLANPEPCARPVPSASPPADIAVFALVTGVNHRVAAYGYRGGSPFDRRDFAMAATLVRHPHGDLLIDTGVGRNIDEQFATMPWLFRAVTSYTLWQPAIDRLMAAG